MARRLLNRVDSDEVSEMLGELPHDVLEEMLSVFLRQDPDDSVQALLRGNINWWIED